MDPRYVVEVFTNGAWVKDSEFGDYSDACAYGYYLLATNETRNARVRDLKLHTAHELREQLT